MTFFARIFSKEMAATTSKEMEKSTLSKRDWALKDTPYAVLNETCLELDDASQFFNHPQMLVEQLATGKDTIEWIGESKNLTEIFTSCYGDVKVGRFIDALHEMELPHLAKRLEDWVSKP
ncbi:uncharacterized protein LOC141864663 [Acropora palmata]